MSPFKSGFFWGAWVAQSVKRLTSTQVMISPFTSLSPRLGSVLTAQSLEPALDSVSPSLSAPSLPVLCLSLFKINIKKIKIFYKIEYILLLSGILKNIN